MRNVKSVNIICRNRASEEFDVFFMVNKHGVTKIEESFYSPEPFCNVPLYKVFSGENIIAEVSKPDVVEFLVA